MQTTDIAQIAAGRKPTGWFASIMFGLLAFCIARASGVPIWLDGWVFPGDACDIGVAAMLAVKASWDTLRALLQETPNADH